jgi:hypothetical protein
MRRRERTTKLFGDETRSFDQGLPEPGEASIHRLFAGVDKISDHIISVIECIPTCYKMLPSVYVKHGAASHYREISVGQKLMEDSQNL